MADSQSDPFAEAARKLHYDAQAERIDRDAAEGRLAENLVYFARTLRAAGLPVGPGKVLAAIEAVRTVGLARRDDFYWALHAVFVNRHDQEEVFEQTFHLFWGNPNRLNRPGPCLRPVLRLARAPGRGQGCTRGG